MGDLAFVERAKGELGGRALGRQIVSSVGSQELREHQVSYNGHFDLENAALSYKNRLFWRVYDEDSIW